MTPHDWADVLQRAVDEVRASLREGVCDGCDHPTCKRDREEADTISAALRTLATAMREAKQVGAPAPSWTTVDVEGRVIILKLPEAP